MIRSEKSQKFKIIYYLPEYLKESLFYMKCNICNIVKYICDYIYTSYFAFIVPGHNFFKEN